MKITKFRKIIKRVLAIYMALILFILGNVRYTYAIPTAPSAPTAPTAPSDPPAPPVAPEAPAPTAPTAPSAPQEPEAPQQPSSPTTAGDPAAPTTDSNSTDNSQDTTNNNTTSSTPQDTVSDQAASAAQETNDQTTDTVVGASVELTGGMDSNEGMGTGSVTTGDADNTGAITNTGANNFLTVGDGGFEGGIVVTSIGNGPDSVNTGTVVVNDDSSTTQVNTTNVVNNMNQVSDSGHNEASKNMNGAEITTGDANVTGTIVNSVNTNIDGVMVSEFNIVDDHVGDIILDFSKGCVSNCGENDITVVNSGNGPDSVNTGTVDLTENDLSFQQNDANVENNMILTANSGDNTANKNMNGETSITTGDANVSANVVNFVNTNIAGDVVYAVVNIFGELIGDIIMPETALTACCGGSDVTVSNSGNGTDSTNTANVNISEADLINQFNNAYIDNNLYYDANTGGNGLSKDMGGDTSVTTGDAEILAKVLNVANTNIITGNSWLVIINEAGKWIGHILGTDGNSSLAGSDGFEFVVNDVGDILAVNSGNGPDTTNTTNVNVTDNNTITQVNNANVMNNVKLSANTGDNEADKNMGGSSIVTGDAKIVANIVNFVNNNIIGDGKLFVTVVNVFGSWLGNFVPPGHEHDKDIADDPGTGGSENLPPVDPIHDDTPYNTNPNVSGGSGSGGTSGGGSSSSSSPSVIASVKSLTPKVLGVSFLKGSASDNSLDLGGASAAQEITDSLGKKSIKLNLAYALFALPLILGFIIVRRRIHLQHASAK